MKAAIASAYVRSAHDVAETNVWIEADAKTANPAEPCRDLGLAYFRIINPSITLLEERGFVRWIVVLIQMLRSSA